MANFNNLKPTAGTMARVAVVSVAVCLFAGCQGRTADNMQPTGETVEVVLDTMAAAPSSSEPAAPSDRQTAE